jgi:3-oxoacyl-[acyl-carrier-protein] synthase II
MASSDTSEMRRVVITGIGAISAFGVGIDALWQGLAGGESRLRPIHGFDASSLRSNLAGQVPEGFSARDHVPKSYRKGVKVMARDTELAVAAALAAVQHAGLVTRATDPDAPPTYSPARVGCQIGAGLIAAEVPELAAAQATAAEGGHFSYEQWGAVGMNNLTPLWMLKYLPNMLACHVTILHDARGPSNTITCAEASGILSIGESMRVIERGDADASLAGGVESKVNPTWLLRVDLAGRVAHTQGGQSGEAIVRPYDPASTGTLIGEGGGILVLEEESHAQSRGARAIAVLEGFGAAQEPIGLDRPATGEGLAGAIRAALRDAGVTPDDIDAIVPQACGCPSCDGPELAALREIFGARLAEIPIVTSAPNIGDLGAGSGAIGVAIAAECIARQELPARIHRGSPSAGVQVGPVEARSASLKRVLVCSGSFGGQCGAVILARPA